MVEPGELVSCDTHGARPAAFVCRHLLASLCTGARVGFHSPGDAADDDQAWCDACERVRAREGEWNDRSEAYPDVQLICLDCFHRPGSSIGGFERNQPGPPGAWTRALGRSARPESAATLLLGSSVRSTHSKA